MTVRNRYDYLYSRAVVNEWIFQGVFFQVYLIGDCVGGILLYQALSTNPHDDDTNSSVTDDFHSATDLESLDLNSNYHQMFDFDVSALFTFGCPVGLVCFKQKLKGKGQ